MSRKLVVLVVAMVIVVCCGSGCKKRPATKPESMEYYRTQAKEQITKKNMAKELAKIEKDIEQDLSGQ